MTALFEEREHLIALKRHYVAMPSSALLCCNDSSVFSLKLKREEKEKRNEIFHCQKRTRTFWEE